MKKFVLTTLTALWMGVIFWFSSKPALESSSMSNNIIDNTIYKNEDLNDSNKEKLFEKYKGKTGVYKLVFNKDDSNNWYWEETQIIK